MRARFPLFGKVLCVAFLNLCLLGVALAFIMRAQFRLDPGSFLLAPAESRIMATAQAIALDLDAAPPGTWSQVLEQRAKQAGIALALFDDSGQRIAGPDEPLPREVSERIPRRPRPLRNDRPPRNDQRPWNGQPPQPDGRPPRAEGARPPATEDPRPGQTENQPSRNPVPPLFLTATSGPTRYWAGVRIPVRRERDRDPHPGVLVMSAASLLASRLFFDPTPWITIGAAVILISVACWLPFIRGATRSISQMTRAAGRIAEGRFETHVDERRRDEIGQLGGAINRMALRLSGFVNGQRRFLSGIAHELCTPIATLQFGLGNLERRVGEAQRDLVADIQDEVQHMATLVNELLSFSRAGMQALDVKLIDVNVAGTVARVLERETTPETPIEISVDERLNVRADPEYLFRALSNLVRNAIRYAGAAGPIKLSARAESGSVLITVADWGPGVPEDSLEEIFAPFYRLDPSRNQATGGMGLGLAIVRTCVEACHGSVRARNLRPKGLELEIRLPEAKAI